MRSARAVQSRAGMEMMMIVPLEECLADTPVSEHWLHCAECKRFFHLHSVKMRNGHPECPFSNCGGVGFDFDLFFWDSEREPEDPRWPSSAAELHFGMRSPDMAAFYEGRAKRRHAELIAAFEASGERAAFGAEYALRFLEPFLWMQYCTEADPDDAFYMEDLARMAVDDLYRWAGADAIEDRPALIAELRAFWAFAERTSLLPAAAQWHELLRRMATEG